LRLGVAWLHGVSNLGAAARGGLLEPLLDPPVALRLHRLGLRLLLSLHHLPIQVLRDDVFYGQHAARHRAERDAGHIKVGSIVCDAVRIDNEHAILLSDLAERKVPHQAPFALRNEDGFPPPAARERLCRGLTCTTVIAAIRGRRGTGVSCSHLALLAENRAA